MTNIKIFTTGLVGHFVFKIDCSEEFILIPEPKADRGNLRRKYFTKFLSCVFNIFLPGTIWIKKFNMKNYK